MLAAVVAMAHNNVIGNHGSVPWYLPADLKHFKDITINHSVIMGRTTCDSIITRLGHGLPERQNIVLTRDKSYQRSDTTITHSLTEALDKATHDTTFVIGGQQIYELAFDILDRLYITYIDAEILGDTYFPAIDLMVWQQVSDEKYPADERNQYPYRFVVFDRVT